MPGEADLYGAGFTLQIEHVPTSTATNKNKVEFAAYLQTFSDAYNSDWNAEQVFGRMDPIATFRSTRRALSVAWTIPSSGPEQAAENLWKINKLLTFLYPTYESRGAGGASTINMGPLFRVKFGNLIQNTATGEGLLGYVNGFTFDPELDEGFYTYNGKAAHVDAGGHTYKGSPLNTGGVEYIPKTVRLNFELVVLHEHPLGFKKDTKQNGNVFYFRGGSKGNFPYGTGLNDPGDMINPTSRVDTPPKPTETEDLDTNTPARATQAAPLAAPGQSGIAQPGSGGES